jgi:hypothetical protein
LVGGWSSSPARRAWDGRGAVLDLGAAAAALFVAHRWTRTPSEGRFRTTDHVRAFRQGPAAAGDGPAGPSRTEFGRATAAFLRARLLALEVVWFRFLVLFAMSTSRVFAFMLATVLLGIAGGGLLGAFRPRADVRRLLPLAALGAGLTAAYTYAAFADVLRSLGGGHLMTDLPTGAACAALILPTSLLSGALFTMTGAALRLGLPKGARAAGTLTLANTTGSMLGGLVGGFVLLPRFGVERSIFALAAGYGLVALLLFPWGDGPRPARWLRAATAGGAAAFVALLALFPFGLMRNHYLPLAARPWTGDGSRIVAVREGLTETILYLRTDRWGLPIRYRLVTNGFSMSSSSSFQARRYMNLFAYWPLALHPDPRKALLISYGVGSTAKTLTDTPWLESIDVVDVSRDILDLSRMLFAPPERHPLDDPRVRVHLEDGRFFLLTSTERYDIITGEPPPPKVAGIGSLYSREYFQRLHSHLAEGGLATYWLPLSQLEHADALAPSAPSAVPSRTARCGRRRGPSS